MLGILTLPEWGPKIGLSLTEPEILRLRREGIPWLFVFALALIHYLVVREKNSSLALQPWKFHEKKILPIGEKYDLLDANGNKVVRIILKEISIQMMPEPYTNLLKSTQKQIETEAATLAFDQLLSVFPGQAVKVIPPPKPYTESIFALAKNNHQEDIHSVFFFSTLGQEQFFRCFVDHINPTKQEVEIDVYLLQMRQV